MAHISEHHSEKEWETCDSDRGRVSFQICWDTIHIYKCLERSQELSRLKVCWPWNWMVIISRNFSGWILVDGSLNIIFKFNWSPVVAYEALVLPFHEVQSQIKSLFFGQEHLIDVNGGRGTSWSSILTVSGNLIELKELLSQWLLGLVENIRSVAHRALNLDNFLIDLVEVWKLNSLTWERVADFLDFFSDVVSVPKDNNVDRSFFLWWLSLFITEVGELLHE